MKKESPDEKLFVQEREMLDWRDKSLVISFVSFYVDVPLKTKCIVTDIFFDLFSCLLLEEA